MFEICVQEFPRLVFRFSNRREFHQLSLNMTIRVHSKFRTLSLEFYAIRYPEIRNKSQISIKNFAALSPTKQFFNRLLCDMLCEFDLPGIRFLPVQFTPTFDKWAEQSCRGVTLHVTDPEKFRPYRTSVAILAAIFHRWPDRAEWLGPPYEYEVDKMPIDILSGSSSLRTMLSRGAAVASSDLDKLCRDDNIEWKRRVQIDNYR